MPLDHSTSIVSSPEGGGGVRLFTLIFVILAVEFLILLSFQNFFRSALSGKVSIKMAMVWPFPVNLGDLEPLVLEPGLERIEVGRLGRIFALQFLGRNGFSARDPRLQFRLVSIWNGNGEKERHALRPVVRLRRVEDEPMRSYSH